MSLSRDDQDFIGDGVDVCIIGAGVAGAMVAQKLGKAGIRVLMLEAGPRHDPGAAMERMQRLIAGDDPWRTQHAKRDAFVIAGELDYDLNRTRVKAVGGTTMHWSGYTPRFLENDFRMFSTYGVASDWPISYQELEPYYAEAEDELGVSGGDDNPFASPRSRGYPMQAFPFGYEDRMVVDAADALGILFHSMPQARNSAPYRGRHQCITFSACRACPIRARYSGDIHVELAEATGNVRVVSDTTVLRLETGPDGESVRRAVFATDPSQRDAVTASVFVVAAHAVESARLLLLSKSSRHPDGLGNANGLVGRYFMEHRSQHSNVYLSQPVYPGRKGFQTVLCQQFHDHEQRGERSGFTITCDSSQTRYRRIVTRLARESGNWGEAFGEEVEAQMADYMDMIVLGTHPEPMPSRDNRVELDAEVKDVFGNPAPRLTYAISDYEQNAYGPGREAMDALAAQLGAVSQDEVSDHFSSHHSGTCRMGNDPQHSVVNADLRVHAIDNLYVVGSSNFVTLSLVDPTLTLTALALRLGDHLVASRSAA